MKERKPILQIQLEKKDMEKFSKICEETGRNKSNLGAYIINRYIQEYEKEQIK